MGATVQEEAPFTFLQDSREKRPWNLPGADVRKLRTGDYSVDGFEGIFAIERKSFDDLYQCLTVRQRAFKRQLARLGRLRRSMLLLEGSADALMLGHIHLHLTGDEALARLVRLTEEAGVPFCFVGHKGAEVTAALLYRWWEQYNG